MKKRVNRKMINNGKALTSLYITQFLSAFADNMSLLVIAGLLSGNGFSAGSLALVTIAFFVPYIVLAPLVGPFADKMPKAVVLIIGNAIKLLGIALLLIVDQTSIVSLMFCYFTVGIGAVVYSPAKYGILPELTASEQELFQANARIEAYTILAILTGIGGGGAIVAATSTMLSTVICAALYGLSLIMTLTIPRMKGNPSVRFSGEIAGFFANVALLLKNPKTQFTLLGTGSFWMSSAVLRTAVLAWIPLALGYRPDDFSVSLILATTSVGIIIGAFLAPRLIQLRFFYKSIVYGGMMLALIFIFPWFHHTAVAIVFLLAVGFMGGVFIVPMNTILQDEGMKLVGPGKTIAVQNFIENLLMLAGSLIYYVIVEGGVSIAMAIVVQGLIMLLFLAYIGMSIRQLKVQS